MTDQTETNVFFVLNWLTGVAMLVALAVFALPVIKAELGVNPAYVEMY